MERMPTPKNSKLYFVDFFDRSSETSQSNEHGGSENTEYQEPFWEHNHFLEVLMLIKIYHGNQNDSLIAKGITYIKK